MQTIDKIYKLIDSNTCIHCGHIVNEDLRKWFKQKWVNIGKKDKSGKHPKCGTSGDKQAYAKCVPAAKARTMSKKEKESATRRKRAAQNKAGRGGKESPGQGKKPIKVKTERNHAPNCSRKLPGESNAQWRQRCGPRPLGAISMGGSVSEDIKKGNHTMKEDINISSADMEKLHKDKKIEKNGEVIKFEEAFKLFTEKNVPTNPAKWSQYKSQAKKKFDVYPSAYANAWAAKKYKAAGGGWKKESVNEKTNPEMKKIYNLLLKYGNSAKDATAMIKKNYDYVSKAYRNATPRNKAVALVGLQAMGESVNEAMKKWRDIPAKGTIDFGEYGKYVIRSKTSDAISGKFASGSNKGKTIKWYSKAGQKDARKRKGLSMSKTPLFPFDMVKETVDESAPYGLGDMVKDVNPTCPHYGAMGKVTSMNPKSVVFIVKNKGENYKPGDVLEKTHDQMEKMNENKGLWHNINAKKKRGEKSSPKNSKAYKDAKAAGDKLNKQKNEQAYDLWAEDGSFGYTMTGIIEAEYKGRKVKLGKPMQGDVKKFKVYVKNPKGNVVKVNFGQGGDAKGGTMKIRKSNPEARKSFRARHNCDNPGPRHKARYWSCRKW